ncbi:MAG: hypothetical protein ACTSW3_04515, partial [Promethearchaeota archaeon]
IGLFGTLLTTPFSSIYTIFINWNKTFNNFSFSKLSLTSGFNEVQNLRYPANFEFGWKGNFAWQNSRRRFPVTVKLLLSSFPIRSVGNLRPQSKIVISVFGIGIQ